MKLAIYADSKGRIAALAVCQVTLCNDHNGPREISIRAERLQKHDTEAELYKTHIIDLPSYLAEKPHYELAQALQEIHASMYLDLTQSSPCLYKYTLTQEKKEC
jgi:hypothetical protein